MANRPPAFQFYAKDWLSSKAVLMMSPLQRGYYINLLAHAWDNTPPGTLPNDPDKLWRMSGARSRRVFEKDSEIVLSQFPIRKSVRVNPRLRAESRSQIVRRRALAVASKSMWERKKQALAKVEQASSSSPSSA